jgi:hypothetical protein
MSNKFAKVMAERTDAELIHIITISREDYLPEALLAAENELEKRNLSPEQIGLAMNELINEQLCYEDYKNANTSSRLGILAESLGAFFFFDIF